MDKIGDISEGHYDAHRRMWINNSGHFYFNVLDNITPTNYLGTL